MSGLSQVALITLIALKLAGVVTWSWWWVLSPLWISGGALALLLGGLVILWCLGSWADILAHRLWRAGRHSVVFVRFEDMNGDSNAHCGDQFPG